MKSPDKANHPLSPDEVLDLQELGSKIMAAELAAEAAEIAGEASMSAPIHAEMEALRGFRAATQSAAPSKLGPSLKRLVLPLLVAAAGLAFILQSSLFTSEDPAPIKNQDQTLGAPVGNSKLTCLEPVGHVDGVTIFMWSPAEFPNAAPAYTLTILDTDGKELHRESMLTETQWPNNIDLPNQFTWNVTAKSPGANTQRARASVFLDS